jgi:hypothetical protein
MDVVVPLAGPDFVSPDGAIKALTPISGHLLLQHVLASRPWAPDVRGYTFILKDGDLMRTFSEQYLRPWFPDSTVVYLSSFTRGAACSAMAGVACQRDPHVPLIVDLADILYSSNLNVASRLMRSTRCGGLALTFSSTNPSYSYLRLDEAGRVIEAAEKKLISTNASAGTYIFRNSAIYLSAVAHAYANEATQAYNNLFYVCPLFNGVLAQGLEVELETVSDVRDIKN